MTTKKEEGELDTELQELYLVSKQWIADLDFLDSELDFLIKLTGQQQSDTIRVEEFARIGDIAQTYGALKTDITDYLRRLQPLITHASKDFGLDLIEEYSQLQQRLKSILLACHEIRTAVFDTSRHNS